MISLAGLVKRCNSQRTYLIHKALLFEDIKKQQDKPERRFTPTFGSGYKVLPSTRQPSWYRSASQRAMQGCFKEYRPVIAWYWYMRLRPVVYYLAAALSSLLSIVVVWSEVRGQRADAGLTF